MSSIILKMIFYNDTLNFFEEKKYNDFKGRIKDESHDTISINFLTGKFTFKLKKIFQSISQTYLIKIERSLNESILKNKT